MKSDCKVKFFSQTLFVFILLFFCLPVMVNKDFQKKTENVKWANMA